MFKILDKYIIKKYLATFFFTALIFSMISVVIDFSEKAEKYVSEPVTAWQVITEYYLNFIPFINGLLWPLFSLIAVIFFTSRLARNSEIISILNAGVSFRRLLLPYMLTALFLALIHSLGAHFFIPMGNKTRLDFENTYLFKSNDEGQTQNVHLFIGESTKIYIRYYRKSDTSARDIRIETFNEGQLTKMIKARSMEIHRVPNTWRLKDYEVRTFDEMEETVRYHKGKSLDTTLRLEPRDFVRYVNEKEMMTTPELRRFIRSEHRKGRGNTRIYEVETHRRTAESFTIIILTLIGVTVASRKVRGGLGLHLAIGVGLGALYIFLSRFTITFAVSKSIPALLGVWLPNIFFTLVALYLLRRAQK